MSSVPYATFGDNNNKHLSNWCHQQQQQQQPQQRSLQQHHHQGDTSTRSKSSSCKNLLLLSAVFAFSVGLTIGLLIALVYFRTQTIINNSNVNKDVLLLNPHEDNTGGAAATAAAIRTIFLNNSYSSAGNHITRNNNTDMNSNRTYSTVSFVETPPVLRNNETDGIIEHGIFWGRRIEKALPEGYSPPKHQVWASYIKNAVATKLENGCGRMQNRLVVFQDGLKGCVRYRQNTDQIQGELFSFYLAQILKLPNLAPSTVSVVNLGDPLWSNLAGDIAAAQWNSNKPVVLTQYISNLGTANIPAVFKPVERHLNKLDVLNMTSKSHNNKNNRVMLDSEEDLISSFVELAQWSDLIIFDYLTANLDRIVNNLYNYQWNVNIMDAPAHNLARKSDSDLLVFLDNESGLLHGYRLLKKYEIYHSILLENLCIFRKSTAEAIRQLKRRGDVGELLRRKFEEENGDAVKDILPTLPDKSVKILNERIDKVYGQIKKLIKMKEGDCRI